MPNARIPGATPAEVGCFGGLFQRSVYFQVKRRVGRVTTRLRPRFPTWSASPFATPTP